MARLTASAWKCGLTNDTPKYPILGYRWRRWHSGWVKRATEGDAVKSLRVEAGLTQTELASILGQPQSFISKIEAGERTLHVSDLEPLAQALGCQITTILNRITGFDSVLDRWALSESELTELIDSNPSLRGMVLGYAAEVKFRRMFLNRADIKSTKDDDHNRKKKGDRRLLYKGEERHIGTKVIALGVSFRC